MTGAASPAEATDFFRDAPTTDVDRLRTALGG